MQNGESIKEVVFAPLETATPAPAEPVQVPVETPVEAPVAEPVGV